VDGGASGIAAHKGEEATKRARTSMERNRGHQNFPSKYDSSIADYAGASWEDTWGLKIRKA
jgi:hypothetical protein